MDARCEPRTDDEITAFATKFELAVKGVVLSMGGLRSGEMVMMNAQDLVIMRSVLLFQSGMLEGVRKAGTEAAVAVGALDPCVLAAQRSSPDEIYQLYTSGFNYGINMSDSHKLEVMTRLTEVLGREPDAPTQPETKTEPEEPCPPQT